MIDIGRVTLGVLRLKLFLLQESLVHPRQDLLWLVSYEDGDGWLATVVLTFSFDAHELEPCQLILSDAKFRTCVTQTIAVDIARDRQHKETFQLVVAW